MTGGNLPNVHNVAWLRHVATHGIPDGDTSKQMAAKGIRELLAALDQAWVHLDELTGADR